jgi:methionyl-tRNA synthetase
MAYDGGLKLPDDIPAFEFLNLEGKKISTSRNHAVWLHDIVDNYPADVIRYYMTYVMPETKDADFKRSEFMERNNELVNTLGNLVNRTLAFSIKNFDGELGGIHIESLTDMDRTILDEIKVVKQNFIEQLDSYKFKDAINSVFEYLRNLNKYFNDKAPWILAKEDKIAAEHVMSVTAVGILSAALLFSPFMPGTANKVFQGFGLKISDFDFDNIHDITHKAPFILENIGYLFTRMENEDVERELAKLTV